jgi:beta-lactamase regulating signal transducer with metallopeptidase domain
MQLTGDARTMDKYQKNVNNKSHQIGPRKSRIKIVLIALAIWLVVIVIAYFVLIYVLGKFAPVISK